MKGRTTSAPKISKTPASEAVVVAAPTLEGSATSDARRGQAPPTRDAIAQRAYAIYLERGGQDGHEAEDWLTAERELGG